MVTLSEPSRPDLGSVAEGPMATQSPRFHIGSDGDARKRRVASRRPAIRRGIRCGPRVGVASREGVPASRRATSCPPCAHGARARRTFPRRIPWRCSASPCGMRCLSRSKRPLGRPAAGSSSSCPVGRRYRMPSCDSYREARSASSRRTQVRSQSSKSCTAWSFAIASWRVSPRRCRIWRASHLAFAHVHARRRRAGHLRRRIIWSIGGCHPEKKKRTAPRGGFVLLAGMALRASRGSRVPTPRVVPRAGRKKKDRRFATVRDGAPESNRMRAHVRAARACVALRDSSPSPVARYPPVPLSSVRSGLEPQWTERRLPDRRPSASHAASRDAGRRHGAACRVAPSRPRIEHKTPWRRPRGLM